jgi:hypothetical protein
VKGLSLSSCSLNSLSLMPIVARPYYVLQAVQPEVGTTGMLANFNQALFFLFLFLFLFLSLP